MIDYLRPDPLLTMCQHGVMWHAGLELQATQARTGRLLLWAWLAVSSMRKQELGRESSRRVIGWHSSCGSIYSQGRTSGSPLAVGHQALLLGRLQPGPRRAANHSRGNPLLGKLWRGVAQPKHLLLPKVWSVSGSPAFLSPTPKPEECTESQQEDKCALLDQHHA